MFNKKTLLSMSAVLVISSSNLLGASFEKTYASVNGEKITSSDIALIIKDPRVKFDSLPKENQKQILDQLISKKLLETKAVKSDVIKDPIYKDTLEKTIKSLKKDLALQIWMQKMSQNIVVTQKELKDYYNKNKVKLVQPEELKASHILVKTEQEAKNIIKKLNKSSNLSKEFAQLAQEKSIGPSGKSGGKLGWFTKDKMVPEFSMACSFLKKGTITQQPVKTQFGYHVIYLEDKKEASTIPFANVKDKIKQFLAQNKFKTKIDSMISDLKSKAKIIYK